RPRRACQEREMTRRLEKHLHRWLAAERREAADEAEGALHQLVRSLPQPRPSRELTARILANLGVRPAPAFLQLPWAPGPVVLALVLAGSIAPLVPGILGLAVGRVSPGGFVAAAFGALRNLQVLLIHSLRIWDTLTDLGHGVSLALAQPRAAALLLAGMLMAT